MRAYFYFIIFTLLAACSSHHTPAPVVEIEASKIASKYRKGTINSDTYIVSKGETLYSIAWRSDNDIRTLALLNKLSPPYKIFPGQKIYLSDKSANAITDKTSKQKLNNYSTKKVKNQVKKPIASNKKQEYGESVSRQKASKNLENTGSTFSQKIRKWQWPAKGKIVSYFSTKQEGNKGINIAGRRGENIVAAADGIVVYAGNALRGYGRLVIIKHNDDYLSAYAHNDKILVKEQQNVKAGEKIAKMGDTDAERVMLHFEVRFRGKSVNPMKYLPKK